MIFVFIILFIVSIIISVGLLFFLTSFSSTFLSTKPRLYTPQTHQKKNSTIAIGGVAFLAALTINLPFLAYYHLLTCDVIIIYIGSLLFGLLGLHDDFVKLHNNIGLSVFQKAFFQIVITLTSIFLIHLLNEDFYKRDWWPISSSFSFIIISLWILLVVVGTVNAVNITDGLDLLATVTCFPIFISIFFIAYLVGNFAISGIISVLLGSLFGFAFFNKQPAFVWMGDVGSLLLGASISLSMLLLHHELLLPIIGFILVVETVTVIIQIFSVRWHKKKFFKMAPLHHHFELCGYSESFIVMIASMISLVLNGLVLIIFFIIK